MSKKAFALATGAVAAFVAVVGLVVMILGHANACSSDTSDSNCSGLIYHKLGL
jgi:hypothetical protein